MWEGGKKTQLQQCLRWKLFCMVSPSWLDTTEENISEHEDIKTIQNETQRLNTNQ
jgi:hypothetical protein